MQQNSPDRRLTDRTTTFDDVAGVAPEFDETSYSLADQLPCPYRRLSSDYTDGGEQ